MKRAIALLIAGVGTVGVIGCGGEDESGSSDRSAGPNAVREIQPEAEQRAEAMLLQLSDLPKDWRATPSDEASDEDRAAFLDCLGVDLSHFTMIGDADSDDFGMADSEVSSSADIFNTENEASEAAAAYADALSGPRIAGCFKDVVEESLEEEGESGVSYEVGDVEAGELNVSPPSGVENSRAIQVETPVQVEGISISFFLDVVVLQEGNAVAEVQTQDESSPLDSELRDQLVQVVASRMSGGE